MISRFTVRKTAVIFGPDAVYETGEAVKKLGVAKALCVYGPNVKKTGIAQKVIDSLEKAGVATVSFDHIEGDVPDYTVDEAAALGKENEVDVVVGIGGGSALDTAKAINAVLGGGGVIRDYLDHVKKPIKGLPLVMIPTTSGTGSEITIISVVTDTKDNRKIGVVGPACDPQIAVIDPVLAAGMPKSVTAYTGMDAFSHSVEAYTSRLRNPFSDTLAEKAITLIKENLPKALEDGTNLDVRTKMSYAAFIAGAAFRDSVVHIGHSIAHSLGATFHISHGIGCAISLPAVVEFVADTLPEKVYGVGELLGAPVDKNMTPDVLGKTVSAAIRDLQKVCGMPSFADAVKKDALTEEEFDKLTEVAMADSCTMMSAKKMTPELMKAVIRRACYPDQYDL